MAELLVSALLDQFVSIATEQAKHHLTLVTGVDEAVGNLTSNLEAIQAVLEDAEKRQVKESAVKHWLAQLKDVSYDIDNVLDEWNTEFLKRQIEATEETRVTEVSVSLLKKLRSFIPSFCFCVGQVVVRHHTAVKIEEVDKRLAEIANQRSRYDFRSESSSHDEQIRDITTSLIDESEVFVEEEVKKTIKDLLLLCDCDQSSSSEGTRNPRIISVVGMGGIGKTTLTRLAFNDPEIVSHFEERIWVCVSDSFEEVRISKEILESLLGRKPDLDGKDNILREISNCCNGKKILLVLDDVWTEDSSKWEQLKGSLKNSSPTSRVLVTTRKREVGMAMGSRSTTDMLFLGTLSDDKCWSLFSRLAFFDRTTEERKSLKDIGKKIVERCRGLPLAVKTLGGLLRFKTRSDEWQSILESKMWEIEGIEKGVFPPLLLSYYDLPPVLRQCFSYCAIFPKDFELKKDKLIKLWMAQGFVKERGNKGIEVIGDEYFNTLAMRSFFQDFERDDENNDIIGCKMHDIVHDFAQFLTEKECSLIEFDSMQKTWKENPSSRTFRHSMLMFEEEGATFPIPMDNWKGLRTLLINSPFNYNNPTSADSVLNSVIDQLTCVRALDFNVENRPLWNSGFRMISDKIGKLIHLRYLSLSGNRGLMRLPEAICDLYNLQTLDITRCDILTELPRGIGKLISLKYLENGGTWDLRYMPKGMERLTQLQTLKEFVVSSDRDDDACSLHGLGNLTHLQGVLRIKGLGNVADASVAMEARLSSLTGLRQLNLEFDDDHLLDPENEALVVEALQPPPNLETLEIWRLNGPSPFLIPNWMNMLKSVILKLGGCSNWERLPPMGKLPSLEYLRIFGMEKVKKVGEEFLGIERQASSSSSSSNININIVAFPNLKSLEFYELPKWEEWEYDDEKIWEDDSSCNINIMPRLHSLKINNCKKLKALPCHLLQKNTAPTIQNLLIVECALLEERFEEGTGEDWHYISRIPNITINWEEVQSDGVIFG